MLILHRLLFPLLFAGLHPSPDIASRHSPEPSRSVSSLNAEDFMKYMDESSWKQGGVFADLLSAMGHRFKEEKGRMVTERWRGYFAPVLTLIIFEL